MTQDQTNKFKAILADPPWDVSQKGRWGAASHYDTMTIPEICGMGGAIRSIADKDCWLFLWVTNKVFHEHSNVRDEGRGEHAQVKSRMVLSPMLTTAVKMEYVHRNVASLVSMPKYKPKERNVWLQEEVKLFLDSIKEHRYYPIFLVFFHYGMRRGEVLGLRWQDIDFERDMIHIRQQLMDVNHTIHFGEPKTEAGKRDLPLLPIVKEALLKLKTEPAHPDANDDLVFHTKIGTPIDGHTSLRVLGDLSRKVGLKRITLHEIRHTVATMLKDRGVSPKDAQVILGHADIATTLAIYTHSDNEKKSMVLGELADSLTI